MIGRILMSMSMLKHYRHSLVYRLIFSLTILMLLSTVAWIAVTIYLPNELPITMAAVNFLIGFALMVWLVLVCGLPIRCFLVVKLLALYLIMLLRLHLLLQDLGLSP